MPRFLRSRRNRQTLKIAERGLDRNTKALDVRSIIECNEDLKSFLDSFMGRQRLWLLKHSKKRIVAIDDSDSEE